VTLTSACPTLTLDEVNLAGSELIHPGRVAIVVLGPAESLVPDLEGLGKVEVVQP
jgi:hypothetical protein